MRLKRFAPFDSPKPHSTELSLWVCAYVFLLTSLLFFWSILKNKGLNFNGKVNALENGLFNESQVRVQRHEKRFSQIEVSSGSIFMVAGVLYKIEVTIFESILIWWQIVSDKSK